MPRILPTIWQRWIARRNIQLPSPCIERYIETIIRIECLKVDPLPVLEALWSLTVVEAQRNDEGRVFGLLVGNVERCPQFFFDKSPD